MLPLPQLPACSPKPGSPAADAVLIGTPAHSVSFSPPPGKSLVCRSGFNLPATATPQRGRAEPLQGETEGWGWAAVLIDLRTR